MRQLIYFTFLLLCACGKKPVPPPQTISISSTNAVTCDVPVFYDYVGHVVAFNTVDIVSQVQGYLTTIYFEQGQEVKQGDLLATIDPRVYQAELKKSQAVLAQSIVNLRYAEDTATRYSKLVQNDFVSQLDFDNYVSNVLSEEAVIKQNLADIEIAQLDLNYCFLIAPMDSVAGLRQIDEGNFIPVSVSSTSNPIVTLNQIKPVYVNFYIPEDDLTTIRKAQGRGTNLTTRVFLESNQIDSHDGQLTFIDNQVDISTGSIELEATLPNDDKALWPGQFATVRLFIDELKGAVVVPSQAVQIGQNGPYVFVIKADNTAEIRNVKKGEVVGDYTVVSSGLAEGEEVVLEGQVNLIPGAKVSVNNKQATVPTFDAGLKAP